MSRWVRNPQGTIITFFMERSGNVQAPLNTRSRIAYGGIIVTVALAIIVLLLAVWPSDEPTPLPLAGTTPVEDRLVSGVAGQVHDDEYLFALTADGAMRKRPALAVFATNDAGTVQRIANLPAPVADLRDDLPASPRMAVSDAMVYIPLAGRMRSVLWIVDVSVPDSPEEISAIELPTEPSSVAVSNGLTAVGPMNGTVVRFFDTGDASQPEASGEYSSGNVSPTDIVLINETLYLANDEGIEVVDISDPGQPTVIGSWSSENWERRGVPGTPIPISPRAATSGEHLLVAADIWGIEVLDISDPGEISRPTRSLSQTQIPASDTDAAIDVAIADDVTLYSLWRERSSYIIRKIDVSDPGNPRIVSGSREFAGDLSLKSLTIAESQLYFLNGDSLHVIDLSDRPTSTIRSRFHRACEGLCVHVSQADAG